ncbi:hypothetical protein TNCV_1635111 [Trichonephila clavipes]|nr:hypothetical protein TNCV_1635111 [Trichonephila clavipes]
MIVYDVEDEIESNPDYVKENESLIIGQNTSPGPDGISRELLRHLNGFTSKSPLPIQLNMREQCILPHGKQP